jgi:hypothetical protein
MDIILENLIGSIQDMVHIMIYLLQDLSAQMKPVVEHAQHYPNVFLPDVGIPGLISSGVCIFY